eukprot:4198084-Lingulodinium_polyedra.AAC.1
MSMCLPRLVASAGAVTVVVRGCTVPCGLGSRCLGVGLPSSAVARGRVLFCESVSRGLVVDRSSTESGQR